MKLKIRIQEDMKNAMRSGAQDELKVIRLILSAIKQIEVDTRVSIEDDNQVLDILNKMMKQRRDSISQFEQGGRKDLADIENGTGKYNGPLVGKCKRVLKVGLNTKKK